MDSSTTSLLLWPPHFLNVERPSLPYVPLGTGCNSVCSLHRDGDLLATRVASENPFRDQDGSIQRVHPHHTQLRFDDVH